jgi:chromosome segregation ATPase
MEKSNSRSRRNGDASQPNTAAPSDQTTIPASTSAQEARQRIEAVATLENERPSAGRNLQDTFIDERNDVLAVINELEDQLDRHQEIRATLERELTEATEKLQVANQRTQELEWRAVTLQTRVDAQEQLRGEVSALEEELADTAARAQRTNEQLLALEKDRNRLKGDLKATQKQLDELWAVGKERDGLRSECKLLSTKVEELERAQRDTISDRTALQAQLQDAERALEETTVQRNQAQTAQRAADDRVHELTQVQEALDDKLESLRNEKKNFQVQIAHLERENARLIEQRQFYECEVSSLRNQSRAAESALTAVKKAFSEVRVALTDTKTRARRRTFDSWPRIGTPLRGLPAEADPSEPEPEMAPDEVPAPPDPTEFP